MGNATSNANSNINNNSSETNISKNVTKNVDNKSTEEKILDTLLNKSNKLIYNYKNKLDGNFCDKVAVIMNKTLNRASMVKLNKINNKLNEDDTSNYTAYLESDINDNEYFIVDELKDEIINVFNDNSVKQKGGQNNNDDNNDNNDNDDNDNNYNNNRNQGRRNDRRRNNRRNDRRNDRRNRGRRNDRRRNSRRNDRRKNDRRDNRRRNDKKGKNYNNISKLIRQLQDDVKKPNRNIKPKQNVIQNIKKNNKVENINTLKERLVMNTEKLGNIIGNNTSSNNVFNFGQSNNTIKKNITNLNKQRNKLGNMLNKKIDNNVSQKNKNYKNKNQNVIQEFKQNVKPNVKNIKPNVKNVKPNINNIKPNVNKNVKPNVNNGKPNFKPNVKNTKPNFKPNVNNRNQKPFTTKRCNNKSKRCELTKEELCRKISEHYSARVLLAKYIRNQLPYKKSPGKWNGGLCYDKLKSLRDGRYCLNPGALLARNDVDETNLLKFVDLLNKQECDSAGGYFMQLKETEKKSLTTNQNRFNLLYMEFMLKIETDYRGLLLELVNILEILENELIISNTLLNELSQKTSEIVNDAKRKCAENYNGAIIALYQADLVRTQKIISGENKLEKMLKNRLEK